MGASRWHNLYSHISHNSCNILHKTHERLSLKLAWHLKKSFCFCLKKCSSNMSTLFCLFLLRFALQASTGQDSCPIQWNVQSFFIFLHCFVAVLQISNTGWWDWKEMANRGMRQATHAGVPVVNHRMCHKLRQMLKKDSRNSVIKAFTCLNNLSKISALHVVTAYSAWA